MVKNPPANFGNTRSTHGSERSPGEGGQPTPVFLPGESPWTEEVNGLQFIGVTKESDMT